MMSSETTASGVSHVRDDVQGGGRPAFSWFPRDVKRAAQIQAAMNEYRRGGSDPVDAVEKLSLARQSA